MAMKSNTKIEPRKVQAFFEMIGTPENGNRIMSESVVMTRQGQATYRGVPGTIFHWHGDTNDPEIEAFGYITDYYTIENAMYDMCKSEYGPEKAEEDSFFNKYCQKHTDDIIGMIQDTGRKIEEDEEEFEDEEMINEKSKSVAQQRFFGMVDAYKKGDMPKSKASKAVKKAAEGMTKKEVKDFAETKHNGLPQHVKKDKKKVNESNTMKISKKELQDIIAESINRVIKEGQGWDLFKSARNYPADNILSTLNDPEDRPYWKQLVRTGSGEEGDNYYNPYNGETSKNQEQARYQDKKGNIQRTPYKKIDKSLGGKIGRAAGVAGAYADAALRKYPEKLIRSLTGYERSGEPDIQWRNWRQTNS